MTGNEFAETRSALNYYGMNAILTAVDANLLKAVVGLVFFATAFTKPERSIVADICLV